MKNFCYLCICFLTLACGTKGERSKESQAGLMLKGEHELRKMNDFAGNDSEIYASFFLFSGRLNQKNKEEVSVKFAWKMNDGTYAISSLPIEKIRIKFDSTKTAPVIKFRWRAYCESNHVAQVQELMNEYVCYAVLIIKESDWPKQIKLPLNEDQ